MQYNSKRSFSIKNRKKDEIQFETTTTTILEDDDDDEDIEFQQFVQWIYSLSREELLNAMAFTFHKHKTEYHDYDLLLELTKLQCPPSTPVHPKAMGYSGVPKLDYYYREESYLRWMKPRLFQLQYDDDSEGVSSNHFDSELNDILQKAGISMNGLSSISNQKNKSQSKQQQQSQKISSYSKKENSTVG